MDASREKVEGFKRSIDVVTRVKVESKMQLPQNFDSLAYHQRDKAYGEAFDKAVADHLGVELSDVQEWPGEQSKTLANEWARNLPDK